MTPLKLVLNNLGRRRGRFTFTLLGIAIGIAACVTFLSLGGNLKREIRRESTALGANLVVTPMGSCAYEQVSILTGEQLPINITSDQVAAVRALDGLTAVPVLTGKTAINNKPVSVSGILPDEMPAFKGWQLQQGGWFSAPAAPEVVIGAALVDQFQLRTGGTLTVRGEQLTVTGVLQETGSRDDITLFLPLELTQRLFAAEGKVSFIAVKVHDLEGVDAAMLRIQETVNLGVVSDRQMLASVMGIVGTVNTTLQLIAAVAVLAAAFGIINTMLTATYERKREIGILQALGARQGTIFGLFLLESGCYGVLGGVVGFIGGLLFSVLAAPHIGQNAFTAFVKGSGNGNLFDPLLMAGTILFSAAVAIAAGLYPAWRAARLSPVEAISYE